MDERVTPFTAEEIADVRALHQNVRLQGDRPCGCAYGRCDVVDLLDSHDALQAERDAARENLARSQEWTKRRVDDYVTAREALHQVEAERDAARAALAEAGAVLRALWWYVGHKRDCDAVWWQQQGQISNVDGPHRPCTCGFHELAPRCDAALHAADAARRAPGAGEPPLPQGSPGYAEASGVWD